jgi:hypothetical protein
LFRQFSAFLILFVLFLQLLELLNSAFLFLFVRQRLGLKELLLLQQFCVLLVAFDFLPARENPLKVAVLVMVVDFNLLSQLNRGLKIKKHP